MNDKRGSKWRKWDLHVHTPASLVHNFKAKDGNDVWETYIRDLESLPKEVQVLGINDYLFIDGYKKVLEYKANGRLQNIQLILPVIEFRIKKFAGHKEFKRINLHVIFSESVTPDHIQGQFLNGLTAAYSLDAGLSEITWGGLITPDSLADLGKKIKATVPASEVSRYGHDIIEGFNNINFDEEKILSLLNTSSYFKDKFLLAIGKTEWDALNWGESSIAEKKDVINKCDIVFTSAENVAAFQRAKTKLKEQGVNHRLLDCSDAHHNSDALIKDKIGKCFTWIKADPSFEGLKQVLHEGDRIFVGDKPELLNRIDGNPTKFIDKLTITKNGTSILDESWFDGLDISLNSGLVAIIGNKGNGKSAIADIIGLCGNTHNSSNFSFLNSEKFRKRKPTNKSQEFSASLTWRNGTVDTKSLSDDVDKNLAERVKYIPQNFLESLCASEDYEDFEKELRKIIFSHTPQDERIGSATLEELISNKSEIIDNDINRIKNDIATINHRISELDLKRNPNYKKTQLDLLSKKKSELDAHEKNKPVVVAAPQAAPNQEPESTRITQLRENITTLETSIKNGFSQKLELNIALNELRKMKQSLTAITSELTNFFMRHKSLYEKYGLSIDEVLQYEINQEVLDAKITETEATLENVNKSLGEEENSLPSQLKKSNSELASLKAELDAPSKLYQQYLTNLKQWNDVKEAIQGEKNIDGTYNYYSEVLRYIENDLQTEFNSEKSKRKGLIEKLYEKKYEVLELYRDLFKPVTDFIESHPNLSDSYKIKVNVSFHLQGFIEKFFDHISVAAKGSFIGRDEGRKRLQQIIESADLNSKEGFMSFVTEIIENIFKDQRTTDKEPRSLRDQLKKGYDPVDFYNFLFSLDFLSPVYKLNLGDKELSELSPGERGALLLIFYLLLDNDDIPLIIDQPEENLDNQSVHTIIGKFIKEVKDNRQIIIVTHNPNLAVVCDAEQIIHVKIAKDGQNKVTYITGAIENPNINNSLVEILEGTFPAFDNRTEKYRVTKRS